MTKTLKERKEELAQREHELKEKLDLNSEGLMDKAKQVGKVALISGGVALIGFWIYKAFFEDDQEEVSKKKVKKRKKAMKATSSKLANMALPYVGKVLDSIFQEDDLSNKEEPKKED